MYSAASEWSFAESLRVVGSGARASPHITAGKSRCTLAVSLNARVRWSKCLMQILPLFVSAWLSRCDIDRWRFSAFDQVVVGLVRRWVYGSIDCECWVSAFSGSLQGKSIAVGYGLVARQMSKQPKDDIVFPSAPYWRLNTFFYNAAKCLLPDTGKLPKLTS